MNKRTISVIALVGIITAMAAAASLDADGQDHTAYCTDVAVWEAEAARNAPLNERTGQPDYKGIAEEVCPGLRMAR